MAPHPVTLTMQNWSPCGTISAARLSPMLSPKSNNGIRLPDPAIVTAVARRGHRHLDQPIKLFRPLADKEQLFDEDWGKEMAFWDGRGAAKENIRLFEAAKTWRRYADEIDATTGEIKERGASRAIDSFLLNGLNATNLLLLTGAGSSFCVANSATSKLKFKTAAGLNDLWDAAKATIGGPAFDNVLGIIPNGTKITDIEKLLTQCKLYVALYGDADENGKLLADFIVRAEGAILARVDFVDAETDLVAHQGILRKLARRGVRKPRTKLFTTNYDLAFEYAARLQRFVVIDGFSHAAPPVYDRLHFELDIVRRDNAKDAPDFLDSVVQLYKLHGSIDWRRTATEIIRARGDEGKPVLIYPRDSKYQEAFEPPYLDMMSAFQTALREPDTALLVAGFSFNDSHLAQPVLAALESNMSFRLVVCDPVFVAPALIDGDPLKADSDVTNNEFHKKLIRLVRSGDERVMLLNGRFEDLAFALPDLVAETERERHAMRIKALHDATDGGKP